MFDSVIVGWHRLAMFTGRSPALEGQSSQSTEPLTAREGDDFGCMRMPPRFFDITVVALITSQFPVSQWHELMADATVADAILDRLVHNAYRLELKGESMRKAKGPGPAAAEAPPV